MAQRKHTARQAAQGAALTPALIKALYDAAGFGRRMRGWNAPSSGPNTAITGLQNIRNRARDASRNDWTGEAAIQKWVTNLIGVGITPRFTRLTTKESKQRITDLWSDFVGQSDADGVLNYYGQQTLVVRSWLESGEVFARRRSRRLNAGYPVPMQVQLLEADFVPLLDATAYPGLPPGNRIASGIELDKFGQRVAYWFYKQHPGDKQVQQIDASLLVRVPSDEVLHIFDPRRPGQLRGVPVLAPVLARLRNINDFDDAVLERQKLANLFVAFITRTLPTADSDYNIDPLTNMPIEWDGSEPLAGMQPGLTQELDPGQDVKFANPPEAGTTYSDYMRTSHLGTAAAAGVPYELFAGDIVNVSDRTLRVIIQEFRRLAEQRQWQIIIPMFCQPVVEWFAEAAMLAGKISLDELDLVRRATHAPHGWQYIHPVQDPQGKQIEVDAGFRSRSSVIAERGDDPEQVDEERAADKKRADELGLTPVPPPVAADPNADPNAEPAKPDQGAKPAPAQQPTQLERALTGLVASQVVAMQKKPEPVMQAPAPAPVVNVTVGETKVNVPAPNVNVTAQMPEQAAPAVNITNQIPEQPAPVVNVEASDAPAPTVVVHAFPKQATQTVETDADGNVTKTITTYEQVDDTTE